MISETSGGSRPIRALLSANGRSSRGDHPRCRSPAYDGRGKMENYLRAQRLHSDRRKHRSHSGLGLWVIEMAMKDAKNLKEIRDDLFISINLSAKQLRNPHLPSVISPTTWLITA
jgi:hypothetical protein